MTDIIYPFQPNAFQSDAFANASSGGAFTTFLAQDRALRCCLIELDYIYESIADSPTGPLTGTLYFSDREFFDDVTDNPYVDCVKSAPAFTRALSGDQLGTYVSSIGTLELDNADGELDFLLSVACDGSQIRFYMGSVDWVVADFVHIFTAIVSKVTAPSWDRISVVLKDTGLLLDKSVGGTAPIGGTGPNADRSQQVNFGYIHNLSALVEDQALLKYRHSDTGTFTSAQEVRDKGVSVYYTDNADGTFTLLASPVGTITCDVLAEPLGNDNVRVSHAMQFFVGERAGLTALGLYIGAGVTFTVGDQDDYKLGISLDQARNVQDLLAEVIVSGNCFWAVKRTGEFTFGRLRLNDIASFGLSERDIYEDDIDQGSFRIDHAATQYYKFQAYMSRNWTRQTDFATSLTPDEQATYSRPGLFLVQPDSVGTTYDLAPELYHKTLAVSPQIDTLLSEVFSFSDVDSLAQWMTTRRAIFLPWIEVVSLTVGLDFYELELGDVVRLIIPPRMGQSDETGVLFQVISITLRLTDAKIDLKIARRNIVQAIPDSWHRLAALIDSSQLQYLPGPGFVNAVDISSGQLTGNPELPGGPGGGGGTGVGPGVGTGGGSIDGNSKLIYVRATRNRALSLVQLWSPPLTEHGSVVTDLSAIAVGGNIHVIRYAVAGVSTGSYSVDAYSYTGTSLGNIAAGTFSTIAGSTSCGSFTASNTYLAFERRGGAGDQAIPVVSAFVFQGTETQTSVVGTNSYFYAAENQPLYFNGMIYAAGTNVAGNVILAAWVAPGGSPSSASPAITYDTGITIGHGSDAYTLTGDSRNGLIYLVAPEAADTSKDALYKFDTSLRPIRTWDHTIKPLHVGRNKGFAIFGDYLITLDSVTGTTHAYLYRANVVGSWSLIQDLTITAGAPPLQLIPVISGSTDYSLCKYGTLLLT